jgi:hypothetical protein
MQCEISTVEDAADVVEKKKTLLILPNVLSITSCVKKKIKKRVCLVVYVPVLANLLCLYVV